METDRIDALNALLVQAEQAHGAFEATELNGIYDQVWAGWYARFAVEHGIGALLGRDVTIDELAAFLSSSYADFLRIVPRPNEAWATYTARRIAVDMSSGSHRAADRAHPVDPDTRRRKLMTETAKPITPAAFQETEGLEDWRVLGEGACIYFRTASFAASARLVQAIGEVTGLEDHAPAVDVREGGVTIRLITVSAGYMGMTDRDVEVAGQISAVARELGLSADPSAVQSLLVIPGAPVIAEVVPFWRAVLGYEPRADSPDEDLVDPQDRGAAFWFESMDEPRPGGGGAIHLAVWVPSDRAEGRVAAALAAGGRLVRDEFAPAWWTLADAAGNEVDVATTMGRD
jgi:4a-hydroxytetrahydrobiopterin dehydratase